MGVLEVGIIVGSLGAGALVAQHYTRAGEALLTARQIIFGIGALFIAFAAISTGSLGNMVAGGLVLFFAGLWVVLRGDDVYEEVTD
jgi:hypothetical protein